MELDCFKLGKFFNGKAADFATLPAFNPPNGSSGYPSKNVFTQTVPARIRRLADRAVSKSRVQTLADKP
jgi:hypothetical protein